MGTCVTRIAKKLHLKKEDATQPLNVKVTRFDVTKAVRKDVSSCALAVACNRQLKIEGAIFFRSVCHLWTPGGKMLRFMLSEPAMEQIKAFDRGQGFETGSYRLLPPVKSQKMENVVARSKKRPGRHQPGKTKIQRKAVLRDDGVRTTSLPGIPSGFLVS